MPAALLDEAVREALRVLLLDDQATTADMMEQRIVDLRSEHEARLRAFKLEHADPGPEIAKLESAIARLLDKVEDGTADADVTARIKERRGQVEALRAQTVTDVPDWMTFDRAALIEGMRTAGGTWLAAPPLDLDEHARYLDPLLSPGNPRLGRQVLRRLGIERITVTSAGDGWTFEGGADLAGLCTSGPTGGPSRPPI